MSKEARLHNVEMTDSLSNCAEKTGESQVKKKNEIRSFINSIHKYKFKIN